MKLFIWDFHGVLEAGTENTVYEISNQVLTDFGYKEQFTLKENHDLFGRKWYEYFEYLLPHESHERHLTLQQASFEMSDSRPDLMAKHVRPNEQAHDVLGVIAKKHRQIIISNTKPSSLNLFLDAAQMTDYFGPENAFAVDLHSRDTSRTKRHVLDAYLLGHPADSLITIGDSARDMELTKPPEGVRYLYARPDRQFKAAEAEYRIHDLRDITREI